MLELILQLFAITLLGPPIVGILLGPILTASDPILPRPGPAPRPAPSTVGFETMVVYLSPAAIVQGAEGGTANRPRG